MNKDWTEKDEKYGAASFYKGDDGYYHLTFKRAKEFQLGWNSYPIHGWMSHISKRENEENRQTF